MTQVTPPIKGERHLIDSVSFRGQIVVCTCGVTTTIEGWPDHRGALGSNRPTGRHKQQNISGDGMGGSERWR